MPRFKDPETNREIFWDFETAFQQLETEQLKGKVLKP